MDCKDQKTKISAFEKEVYEGLTAFPKYLSSKFIYDQKGDKLFQNIMELPEYYLTRKEFEILNTKKSEIVQNFDQEKQGFHLIELGAGDGKKTKVLLKELLSNAYNFTYNPIDISSNAVENLKQNLQQEMPSLKVQGLVGEYFEVLDRLKYTEYDKKIIMVLGSNIGNLLHPRAIKFLQKLCGVMGNEDLLFMGFDQKKNPQTILNAYNDSQGVTAAFNKNILVRINTEFDANFNVNNFLHWETYDPESGTAKSYLVSKEKQSVDINALGLEVCFEKWETIHTEISQKYDDHTVKWLAKESGLKIINQFSDVEKAYQNYLFQKV
ncbi:L-histidine N(alpha)-methyltransferase [Aquimarina brevivitae]|uniref:Dimethylhistidine N-methyltransferase n=1 Tax=Aquimarina brevivitae TaxID=323412 RepID=A0A4Q7NXZ0_9FLAO|nr:L-histidine N(alpha)-methyltransferase [Aquimarina brevivitae]RZS92273.1 dimethylhistidine N-methyltransferase [Aquimarina brevivitae]